VTFVERIRPAASSQPEGALVLLHGRGADEHDLFGLLDAIDPGRRLVGVTPRAPLSLPPGGAHWYAVYRVGFPDPDTFWPTFRDLCDWYEALPERLGFPAGRIVLGGFSQGCVMSYALGLAAGRPAPRALFALSGFMPVVDGLELDLDRPGLRLVIEHGVADPVISVGFARDARARLEGSPISLSYREFDGGHWVDPATLPTLQAAAADALA
jgi:phospholipase/carboxylesterase